MFYLKKVIAIIENSAYRDAIERLGQALRQQGMGFLCFFVEDMGLTAVAAENVSGVRREIVPSLWMTDMSQMAGVLRQLNYPVLAFLHENNRSQDFSVSTYACEDPENLDAQYMDRVYRRYKRLPWDILETDRCLIRETTPEDVGAFYEIYKEPSITRYTEGLFAEPEQERKYINDYIDCVYSFYNLGIWTILKKDTNEVIGRAGLSYRDGYEEPEIGFVIGCPWQRQGYAQEVCHAILEYGREEFEFTAVQAFVRPENKASLALCRKLGMQPAREVEISGEQHLCMKINF